MIVNLCTYFDRAYLAKGIALLRSLARHLPEYRCYVLALDDLTFDIISGMYAHDRRISVVPLRALERREFLLAAKQNRLWREYIFTLTPAWALYLIEKFSLASLAYMDADTYLFADLAPLYAEVEQASVAIIPHRWTPKYAARLQPNGIYNVGWVYWRGDAEGRRCLQRWQDACLGWRAGPGREKFSDQIYLDDWPGQHGAHIVRHLGANLAPWNQERYTYAVAYKGIVRQIFITDDAAGDGPALDQLLFYHFHEFRQDQRGIYRTGYPLARPIADIVYASYEKEIADAERTIAD